MSSAQNTALGPEAYFDAFCTRYQPYKGGAWCYEDGCIYRGLLLLHEATGEARWQDHLIRLCSAQVSEGGDLAGYDPDEFNIDNILAGRVLLPLAEMTGQERYRLAAGRLASQLDRHPRLASGNYWHKKRYPHQVWLDGLYMALPFQVEYALANDQPQRIADVLQQLSRALALTDRGGGLYCHGYDESGQQRWANPETGKSAAVWARAMGWLAMGLVDVLGLLPQDASTRALRRRLQDMLAAILNHQCPSGLWRQVLDMPQLPGNYEESSASAMFAYALQRAGRFGLVEPALADQATRAGRRALAALTTTRLITTEAETHFSGICLVAGLGALSGPYRDGSPGYYLTEPVVEDDAKGVGPLMMAWAEGRFPLQGEPAA
jgi:unsaturated rhamnogalacturonyl hydrolase